MEDIVSNYEILLETQGTVLNSVVTRRPVQKKSPSRKDWIYTKNRAFIPGWTSQGELYRTGIPFWRVGFELEKEGRFL